MDRNRSYQDFNNQDKEYYELLSYQFRTIKDVCQEIVNLESILHLPKGTEHFISDLHGEYGAFRHLLNSCSGVIKEKIKLYFSYDLSKDEMEDLATLIYYPIEKMEKMKKEKLLHQEWYEKNIQYLIILIKKLSLKYTKSKVRKAIPAEYVYIIEELINERDHGNEYQRIYQSHIIKEIIAVEMANDFIIALTKIIKTLAVDHLHIIGDIYDRGDHPDWIIDLLIQYHHVDIEWGNHDILWMGAACGNEACITRVVRNCIKYGQVELLENSYGISLRMLERYALNKYPDLSRKEAMLKCLSLMVLKTEGILILAHPEYRMQEQLRLNDIHDSKILINQQEYHVDLLKDDCFYKLDEDEKRIIKKLKHEFISSKMLDKHVRFLYEKGSMYLCINNTLLYHGCVPMDEEGNFDGITVNHHKYAGKELFDYCECQIRKAYFQKDQDAIDFMFFVWSGYYSPLSGRSLKSFERFFIQNQDLWQEKRNPYYQLYNRKDICEKILKEFNMDVNHCHIINGHTPVKNNENPMKASGKVIVIDGGFCKSYQKDTGIAGYTLISNSHGLRLKAHTPFKGIQRVLKINSDIHSTSQEVEIYKQRMLVKDTNVGKNIMEQIVHLKLLLYAYRKGIILQKPINHER